MRKRTKDRKWSKRVVEKAENRCQYCGKEGSDPCHIIPRKYLKTRWVIENGICLCREHHILFDNDKGFREKIIEVLVEREIYDDLCAIKDRLASAKDLGFEVIE